MKKLIVVFLMIALCGALWAGGDGESAGPVDLRFAAVESDFTDAWGVAWNAENPDIHLVREEWDLTKWVADTLAGDPADLIIIGAGAEIPYYVNRNMLLDLTDYFKNSDIMDINDIDVHGSGSYQYDGENSASGSWYGLPKDFNNVTAITYNKEIFDAAGLPYPSATEPMTYDEFEAIAAQLVQKDSGGNTIVFGTEIHGGWFKFIAGDIAYMKGVHLLDADGMMNEDPAVRDIWKYVLRLRESGISSTPSNPLSGWAGAAFQAGNIGMVQLGYWYGASTAAAVEGYNEKIGWAPAPVVERGGMRVTNSLGATGVVISAQTKHPDEAFAVFEWYMAGEPGIERAVTGWGIPPLEDNEYNRVRKAIALEESDYLMPPQLSTYVRQPSYDGPWTEVERAFLEGKLTMDEAIDQFYAAVNEAIELGRAELGQ